MTLRTAVVALLLAATSVACSAKVLDDGAPANVGPIVPPAPASDGVGTSLGGCPAAEPSEGSDCTLPGRLCTWTQSCGTDDVGWCTAEKKWQVVVGICQPGCPAERPVSMQSSQDGPPPDDKCTAGLECSYHSTPLDGGEKCHCNATSDGRTVWGLCDSWDDGWKPAPNVPSSSNACGELATCGGQSGCGSSCPNAAPVECGCAQDGLLYCAVKPGC
jgi:hypothetical protein